jgi:hypothetical protein
MKHTIIAAALLLLVVASASSAQTPARTDAQTNNHTPGYDRPDPTTQHQPDGHQHVVYWTDWFDNLSVDTQVQADAYRVEDLKSRSETPKSERHLHRKHAK